MSGAPDGVLAFDLDGTLLDCGPRQLAALDLALGAPYEDPVAFWRHKREGRTTREALIARGMPEPDADAVAGRWRTLVESDPMLLIDAVLAGVDRALADARAHAGRLVVVTARTRGDAVTAQCERLGLMALLDEVIAVPPSDPHRHKAAVLRELGAIGFIGDTVSDARAAAGAGVPFAAVTTGQHTRAVLEAGTDAPIADSLAEAVALLAAGRCA